MAVLIRAFAVLAVAGCFSPAGRECAVTCSSKGTCPSGFVCLADDYCHAEGETELCGPSAVDAATPTADAAPQAMTVDLVADADTFLQDTRDGDNFGGDVAIGIDGAASSGSHVNGLVRFDLSGIPAGSMVTAPGVLRVCTTDDALNAGTVSVHRVIERWSEGLGDRGPDQAGDPGVANWSQRMAATAWTTPGAGAPGSRDEAPASVGGATLAPVTPDTTYSVELEAAVVQGWIDDADTNFGLALVPSTDAGSAFLVSREGANVACRPQLSVTYLP